MGNVLAEPSNSPSKAEFVRNKGPWEGIDDVEIGVAEGIDWVNHRRLHGEIGLVPPAEHEETGYRHKARDHRCRVSSEPALNPGRNTAAMELVVVLPIVVIPLVVMADGRRWSIGGVAMWLASLGFLALWFVVAWRAFDRADAGLEPGSIVAGTGWVIPACAAAACSVVISRRRTWAETRAAAHPRRPGWGSRFG